MTSISDRSKNSGNATRCLEERDDRGLLRLPDREQPLPAAVRVLLDDPGVALDRARSVRPPTAIGSVIESDTLGFALMCSSFRENSTDDVR